MVKLYIGTSGWIYPHWDGIFYPKNLKPKDKLKYFSRYFKTAEINYSFYRLPQASTYQNWYDQTPDGFVFAVKASRFITHIKRLKNVKDAWKIFIKNTLNLKEKLGPILFQFPPSFKANQENLKKLDEFFKFICLKCKIKHLRFGFEFRHKTWCDPEGKPSASYGVNKKIYNLLKEYNVAWVIADSPFYPKVEVATADFIYIRMHGSKVLFASRYTNKELKDLAEKIKKWLQQKRDVFVYFNNDVFGYAIENAKTLKSLLKNT